MFDVIIYSMYVVCNDLMITSYVASDQPNQSNQKQKDKNCLCVRVD